MSHGQFTVAYETVPLAFLISTPKTLRILLVHKIRETRFQLLLFNWACTLFAVLGAGICGFNSVPMSWPWALLLKASFFFSWSFAISADDILLDFALEDEPPDMSRSNPAEPEKLDESKTWVG